MLRVQEMAIVGRELSSRGHNVSVLVPHADVGLTGPHLTGLNALVYPGGFPTWEASIDKANEQYGMSVSDTFKSTIEFTSGGAAALLR